MNIRKKDFLHAEVNAIIKTTHKVVEAKNLTMEDIKNLSDNRTLGEKIFVVGNSKDLPPIGDVHNLQILFNHIIKQKLVLVHRR